MRLKMEDDEQPEIGLIALIDCIFFLLMFFMVATSFKQTSEMQKTRALPVTLPESSASLEITESVSTQVVLGINKDGDLYINNAKVSIQQLQEFLHSAFLKNPHQRIRIDGDQTTSYQNVVEVLNLCQLEGLTNISMHTRK